MASTGFHPVLLISSLLIVLQIVHSQENFLHGSADTFVEPSGSVTLQCQISPGDLPPLGVNGQPNKASLFTWKFRRSGQATDYNNIVNWDSNGTPWIAQSEIMNVLGDPTTGLFNLQITNVTYDSHDGDYYCEVNSPEYRGSKWRVLRSKPFHLFVKYQPQSPQVDYSISRDNLREDQKLVITCSSRDGNPPPQITWLRNGVPLIKTPGADIVYTQPQNRHDATRADLILDPLTKDSHRAVYACRVENPSLIQPLQKILEPLNVQYKPRMKVAGFVGGGDNQIPLTTLAVEAGTEAKLTCSVDANPPVSTPSWRKNGQLFQQSMANYTFTPGSLTRDSAGVYSCVAVNGIGGEQSAEIKVDVFYAPIVSVVPAVISVKEGGQGTLHCQVDSNPKHDTVEWYNSHGDRIAMSEVLTLSDIKRPEAGPYQCRAKMHFQMSAGLGQISREGNGTGRVEVQYKPGMAVIEPATPRAIMGNRIALKCSAPDPGFPEAKFRWRKLDGRTFGSAPSSGEYFNISDAKLDDNGDYECVPYNDIGEGTPKVVRLEVSEPVSWTNENVFESNLVRKIADKPLSLFCSVRGRPAPQFKWLKDGAEISEEDKLYRVATSEPATIDRLSFITRSELKFEGSARTELFSANNTLQRTDRGRYTCVASNDAGQPIARETRIFMQYPPEFVNRYSKVATDFSSTSSTKIECLVESNPTPQISWTRNNQPLLSYTGRQRIETMQNISEETYKSVLTLEAATEADLGEYVCSATNLIANDRSKIISLVRQSVPDEARNLKQKDLVFNAVTLTWDSGFDGGFPQRFTVLMIRPDGSTQEFPVVPADASEFRVTGLLPLTAYNFRVRSESQLGPSRGTSETIDVRTLPKPILAEDIPRPSSLNYDSDKGLVTFGSRESAKLLNLCARIEIRHTNDNVYNDATRCIPFKNNEGAYRIPGPGQEDYRIRLRFCVYDKQDVCGEPVDEQTVLQQASTMAGGRLDIILPIVIVLAVVFFGCLVTCIMCRRRAQRTPVKIAKASNLTLTTHGSVENGANGGFYGSEYANHGLHESGNHGIYATQSSKAPQFAGSLVQESPYGLYAQVDRKLNGDLSRDGNSPYKNQIPDLNGSTMYSSGNMYLQSYPSYDDGYGHQHSPLDPNYARLPVEVNGLPDPYEEYEKTPSFGEESVESGYSTSNSRGRRVIREIIV